MASNARKPRDAVNYVSGQMQTVDFVEHGHIEGGGRRSFFFVTAHMKVIVICAPVGQAVNQPGVAVIGKNNRLVRGEP